MKKDTVTICVVNYKTLDLTRLCLRSICKYTDYPYQVLVIDNDSRDGSTEYLKSLNWIQFVSRTDKTTDSSGGYAHAAALDMGLAMCDTEYFMAMHSDTFVYRSGWLTELMRYFHQHPSRACVGGGKCRLTPAWRQWLKQATDFTTFKRKLLGVPDPQGKYRYYNRTVCSIYRTEVLKKENLSFLMDRKKGLTVGKKLYFELVDRGYPTVELSDRTMRRYLWHLAHATQVVNADEYNLQNRTKRKTRRLMDKMMNSEQVRQIMADESLDRCNE
jgi:glycosyltransferase involved in cell wall biosynthesis